MADDLPDYYAILQVDYNAQQEVIEAAYRRLARIYHPDVNPSQDANQKMSVLNQAYAALSDPAARAEYDRLRSEPSHAKAQQSLGTLYLHVAEQFRAGNTANQVKADLVASGLPDDTALFIVTEVVRALNQAKTAQAQNDILWGSVWFFGGAIVTAGTYMLASQGGGWYLITWGAVIFGGYQLLKGLSGLYSAAGWKGSQKAILVVAVITLILGGIGVAILNEKARQSAERSTLTAQIGSNKQKLAALERDIDSYDVILNGLQAKLVSIGVNP